MWTKKVFYVPYDIAWSPDGALLAVATAQHVQFYNAVTGAAAGVYRGHKGEVRAIAWSPDSRWLAGQADEQTLHVWNAGTGSLYASNRGHQQRIFTFTWSPDGQQIALLSINHQLEIWPPSQP